MPRDSSARGESEQTEGVLIVPALGMRVEERRPDWEGLPNVATRANPDDWIQRSALVRAFELGGA